MKLDSAFMTRVDDRCMFVKQLVTTSTKQGCDHENFLLEHYIRSAWKTVVDREIILLFRLELFSHDYFICFELKDRLDFCRWQN